MKTSEKIVWVFIVLLIFMGLSSHARLDVMKKRQIQIIETQNYILDIQESTIELQGDMIKIDQDIIELI